MAKLYRVILPVADIEKAAAFYSRIFETPGKRVSPGRHYFKCGATILACYDPVADGDGLGEGWKPHFNQYVYFAVPHLARMLKLVEEAGAKIDGKIEKMPWGERMFYARDSSGNPISFVDEKTVFLGLKRRGHLTRRSTATARKRAAR